MKIFLFIIIFFCPVILYAAFTGSGTSSDPYSGGTLTGNQTWLLTNSPIYVSGDLTIGTPSVIGHLTIEAGVDVLFVSTGADLIITGLGQLTADGTSGNQIKFTADNNKNGTYGESGEKWGHISFQSMDGAAAQSVFDYCILEYGDVRSGSNTTSYGGAIYTTFSNIAITNCVIRYNKATHGGGLLVLSSGSPTISNCSFVEDTATVSGGGIYLYNGSSASITNSLITSNYSGTGGGGGIFLDGCGNVDVVNSIIVDNTTTGTDRGYNIQYYIISSTSTRPSFKNCIVWSNDNSISYFSTSLVSTDFVNCGIQDVSNPASSYSNCIDLHAINDNANGPNFVATDGTDWSIKFISPCRDAGTTPSPTVPNDYAGNSRIGPYDMGAYEVQYSRWKTDASSPTSWLNTDNWELGFYPGIAGTTGDVAIPALSDSSVAPDISGTTTIASTKYMILEPGAKATFGTLSNSGTLKLESDADSIASLILDTYTDNGTEEIELYLTGGGGPDYKWHYVSSPVSALPVSTFAPTPTINFVQYIEDRPTDNLLQGWIGYDGYIYLGGGFDEGYDIRGTNLIVGQGYNYYYTEAHKFSFAGTLNTEDVNKAITFDGDDTYNGFNLLGNPFSSGLDWDVIINDISYPVNTSKGLYFTRDDAQCSYIGGVGIPDGVTGIIPPMQGFFTKTYGIDNEIPLLASARTHNSIHERYKGKSIIPLVRLSITENLVSDETVVRFDEQAKPGLDNDFDAMKMFLSDTKTSIYSYSGETKYAINGQPFPETEMEIQIVVNFVFDGIQLISAIQLQGLDNYHVTLKDLETGYEIDLKTTPDLIFTATAGITTDRFLLTISNATGIEDIPDLPGLFNVFTTDNLINIKTLSDTWNGKIGTVKIFDITGRTISELHNKEFWKNSILQVPAPSAKGIYFVEMRAGVMRYVGRVSVSTGY